MLEAVENVDGRTTRSSGGESGRGQPLGPAAHRANAVCPVKVEALLGIGDREDVAVIDGVIIRLRRTGLRQAGQKGEPVSARKSVAATLELHLAALRQWAQTHRSSWRYTALDRHGPRPDGGSSPRIARFVHERVIPFLSEGGASKGCRVRVEGERAARGAGENRVLREEREAWEGEAVRERREGCEEREASGVSPELVLSGIERSFALIGGHKFELVPFVGEPPKRHHFHLRLASGKFLGIKMEPRAVALRRFDSALAGVVEDALREKGGSAEGGGGSADLFSDERYRVVRSPAGRYFASQRCGDYCVEGRDGRLYQFDGVEFGLQIAGLSSSEVMTPFGVRIFRDRYPHMFVEDLGGKLALCMPKSDSYFRSLERLPLEEALLHHLESARQTLCNGYTPGNSLYHPIHVLGRPTLTEGEARERELPVYRYSA